jgi:hypothetical protein
MNYIRADQQAATMAATPFTTGGMSVLGKTAS